jgi:hypothetical protein
LDLLVIEKRGRKKRVKETKEEDRIVHSTLENEIESCKEINCRKTTALCLFLDK